jgi:hypothetical protein
MMAAAAQTRNLNFMLDPATHRLDACTQTEVSALAREKGPAKGSGMRDEALRGARIGQVVAPQHSNSRQRPGFPGTNGNVGNFES